MHSIRKRFVNSILSLKLEKQFYFQDILLKENIQQGLCVCHFL